MLIRSLTSKKSRILAALLLAAVIFLVWLFWMPPLKPLRDHNPPVTRLMQIRRAQAQAKHRAYKIRQQWVRLDEVAEPLRRAVLAAEDDTFYQHHGVDYQATWQSAQHNWKAMRFSQGGSTITQQVVKNLFLSPEKNLLRKLKEALIALQMEQVLKKRRILEIYLNIAEWGRGIFGAEAAAQTYFGKRAADLSLDEAVALVAVLPSPLKHNPLKDDRYLRWRKHWVLQQLQENAYLPNTAAAAAGPETLPDWVLKETQAADEPADSEGNSLNGQAVVEPAADTTTAEQH